MTYVKKHDTKIHLLGRNLSQFSFASLGSFANSRLIMSSLIR